MFWKWILGLFIVIGVVLGVWWMWKDDKKGWLRPYIISFNVSGKDEFGDIKKKLEEKLMGVKGKWAVDVYELGEKKEYGLNQDEIMPAASIMKIPALFAVVSRSGETWTLEEADRRMGSGPLQFLKAGTAVTVERVMTELGKKSDNTAWVMINRRLGYATMEEVMKDWGLKNSNYRDLTTTAEDVGKMWQEIYKIPDLWQYFENSIYEERLPEGIPDEVRVIHKVGTDDEVWADAGIIIPQTPNPKSFILVILNKDVDRDEAAKLVPEITKMIWEHESGKL